MPPVTSELLEAALGRPPRMREAASGAVVGVVGTARCPLSEFPGLALFDESDDFACVLATVGAPLGVALVAVRAREAVRLVAPHRGPEALAAFRRAGHAVLRALAERLAPETGPLPMGPPVYFEGTLIEAVLRTHAPRESTLLSAELRVAGERAVHALAYVLIGPKIR